GPDVERHDPHGRDKPDALEPRAHGASLTVAAYGLVSRSAHLRAFAVSLPASLTHLEYFSRFLLFAAPEPAEPEPDELEPEPDDEAPPRPPRPRPPRRELSSSNDFGLAGA